MDASLEASQAIQLANGEFIKGFIAGQVILCVLIFFLLKVFLLRNSSETKLELKRPRNKSLMQPKILTMNVQQKHTIDSIILQKLKYDPKNHPFESCDWLNILLAQFMSNMRNDPTFLPGLAKNLDHAFNNEQQKRPSFIGPISITEFTIGEEFPELKNARVRFGQDGNMTVQVDFAFDDQITIALDTMALINWPKPGMASLPISLAFTLVRFSGTFVVEFLAKKDITSETAISLCILDDFILDFNVGSLLGHRTKVKDLPKLTSLITSALRNVFVKELVYPSSKSLKIPNGSKLFDIPAVIVEKNRYPIPAEQAEKLNSNATSPKLVPTVAVSPMNSSKNVLEEAPPFLREKNVEKEILRNESCRSDTSESPLLMSIDKRK